MIGDIFIGSSNEQKALAEAIYTQLKRKRFTPLPWWDQRAFRPGDYTLDRLWQLARICEGSVFVFGADDETWFRGLKLPSARDNVLLEYGLFFANTRERHSVIVAKKGIKVPSDLLGLTILFFDSADTPELRKEIGNKVTAHFDTLLKESPSTDSTLSIKTDWNLPMNALSFVNPAMDLYEGRAGATAWHNVEQDASYKQRTQGDTNAQQIAKAIKKRKVLTIVSFGPGMGGVDTDLTSHLEGHFLREYVPIDANEFFLVNSARAVAAANPRVQCRTAFRCNFETDTAFLHSAIKQHTIGPRLFLMAGGTFGNSKEPVLQQLKKLLSLMQKEDIFVFDLFCHGEKYSFERDPMANVTQWTPAVSQFVARALRGKDVAEIAASIEVCNSNPGTADLEGTTTISIREKGTQRVLLEIRRFDKDAIVSAIREAGFSIVESINTTGRNDLMERHVVLAGK